jgi:hypothetical protein
MTYLTAVGSECSGTSSYYARCGMSLDEIHNILISEQHNMTSNSKPCTCCDFPSDFNSAETREKCSVVLSQTQHMDMQYLCKVCMVEKMSLKVL